MWRYSLADGNADTYANALAPISNSNNNNNKKINKYRDATDGGSGRRRRGSDYT